MTSRLPNSEILYPRLSWPANARDPEHMTQTLGAKPEPWIRHHPAGRGMRS